MDHVFGVHLSDWIDADVELVGAVDRERDIKRVGCGKGSVLGLGGLDALTGLSHVKFDGFIKVGTVLGGVVIGEAWPGQEVAGLDSEKPSELEEEARSGMEVVYEGLGAG